MKSFDRLVWWILAGLSLLLAGVMVLGSLVGLPAPRFEPAGDGGLTPLVSAVGPLTLRFAQAMQAESVETRLSLDPPARGRYTWAGMAVSFWPDEALQPRQLYTLRLADGARGRAGQAVRGAQHWMFEVRAPAVIYLAPTDSPDLWQAVDGHAPTRLTDTGGRIFDYGASADGSLITYSARNEQSGTDLWEIDRAGGAARLLLPCGADLCINPAYAPDGTKIAYSRRQSTGTGAEPGLPYLWLLERASLVTEVVTANVNIAGYEPSWSPDGRYLAFADAFTPGVRVADLQSKKDFLVPSELGVTGHWSPDSQHLLVGRYGSASTGGESFPLVVIDAVDVQTGQPRLVLGDETDPADYSLPVYSPDGQWLAFSRRLFAGMPAKQLWVARVDGSQREQIIDDPSANYASYHWSPDGSRLVFQRLDLGVSFSRPQIGVWERDSRNVTILAEDAFQPHWIP